MATILKKFYVDAGYYNMYDHFIGCNFGLDMPVD